MQQSNGIVCAIKKMFAKGTNYSIVGVVAIAIVKTALPILLSQKDL
jgi:hypothetical protein